MAAGRGERVDRSTIDPAQVAPEVLDPTAPGTSLPLDPQAVLPRSGLLQRSAPWIAACCGLCVAGLTIAVWRGFAPLVQLDLGLHAFAVDHRGALDVTAARTVTWGGATAVALPALLAIGCVAPTGSRSPRDRLGAGLLLAGTASLGVYGALLLNHVVGRGRPDAVDWAGTAGGPAFPSGHTTCATVVAVMAAWALSERWASPQQRRALVVGAVAMALAVGWSRWWLGVHWPSDVAGGWLVGAGWGVAAMLALRRLRRLRRQTLRRN